MTKIDQSPTHAIRTRPRRGWSRPCQVKIAIQVRDGLHARDALGRRRAFSPRDRPGGWWPDRPARSSSQVAVRSRDRHGRQFSSRSRRNSAAPLHRDAEMHREPPPKRSPSVGSGRGGLAGRRHRHQSCPSAAVTPPTRPAARRHISARPARSNALGRRRAFSPRESLVAWPVARRVARPAAPATPSAEPPRAWRGRPSAPAPPTRRARRRALPPPSRGSTTLASTVTAPPPARRQRHARPCAR